MTQKQEQAANEREEKETDRLGNLYDLLGDSWWHGNIWAADKDGSVDDGSNNEEKRPTVGSRRCRRLIRTRLRSVHSHAERLWSGTAQSRGAI